MLTSDLVLAQEGTKLGNRKSDWCIKVSGTSVKLYVGNLKVRNEARTIVQSERASSFNRLSTAHASAACAACYCTYGKVEIVC